jgi:hypothetical protein
MSGPNLDPVDSLPPPAGWIDDPWNRFKLRFLGTLVIVVMSVVGIGFIDVKSEHAFDYWASLVVVSGLICMGLAAVTHRGKGGVMAMVARQGLHWLGLFIALVMLRYLYRTGYVEAEAAAVFAVILLTLTTWLAGVHFDPVFLGVAALLALVAYLNTIVERYLVFLVLVLIAVIAVVVLWRRGRGSTRS